MQRIPAEQVPLGARITTNPGHVPMGTVKFIDIMVHRDSNRTVNWVEIELDEGGWFHCIEGELVWIEEGK